MEWNWISIKAAIRKWFRIILRRYQSEIKKYVADMVDAKLIELNSAVSKEVRKLIKNEVVAMAIEQKLDIYSIAGAETVKAMINEYIDKLSGCGE